jgi:hypothetical protein
MADVSTGLLIATIDRSWDGRRQLRQRIRRRLPELQERARKNNQLLVGLLNEGRLALSTDS